MEFFTKFCWISSTIIFYFHEFGVYGTCNFNYWKCIMIYKLFNRELNIRDQNTNKCKEIYKRIESKYEIMKSKLKSNYTYSQNFQLILI